MPMLSMALMEDMVLGTVLMVMESWCRCSLWHLWRIWSWAPCLWLWKSWLLFSWLWLWTWTPCLLPGIWTWIWLWAWIWISWLNYLIKQISTVNFLLRKAATVSTPVMEVTE